MAHVRVNGRWLHSFSIVGDLEWSHSINGGCKEASWSLIGATSNLSHPVLYRGAKVEVFDGLSCVWLGILSEPGDGDVRDCHAVGLFTEAARFMCYEPDGATPTDNVDTAIKQAIVEGWPVLYRNDAPAGLPSEEPQRLGEALEAAALTASKRVTVRADGVLRFTDDPTAPTHLVMPGVGTLARADDEYVTHVVVYYVKSVSGTPPVPDNFGTVKASDPKAAAANGRSSLYVNLTERGVITDASAANFAAGLLKRGAARLSFANGLVVDGYQLRGLGMQQPSMARLRDGMMVRLMGVRSPDVSQAAALDVVVAGTSYRDGSGEVTLTPLGLAPRTLADVIASIPTKAPSVPVDRSA